MKRNKFLCVFFTICLCSLICFSLINISAVGEKTTESIGSSPELKTFIQNYNSGNGNYADNVEVTLALSGAIFDLSDDVNFEDSLGTSTRPFKGKIIISQGASSEFKLLKPLFGVITSDVKIVDTSGSPRTITLKRSARKGSGNTIDDYNLGANYQAIPLFVDTVEIGDTNDGSTTWNVIIEEDNISDNKKACDFGGLIGTIETGCNLQINATFGSKYNGSLATIKGDDNGNIGLICNTVGNNVNLTASISLSNDLSSSDYPIVTTTNGHAGGFIGEMGDACTLTITNAETCISEVTTTGTNKSAGNIVGKMGNDSTIVFTQAFETSANVNATLNAGGLVGEGTNINLNPTKDITINKQITSTSSSGNAGGFYGKYTSTIDRAFDLTHYKTTLNDCVISSPGNTGGIFGMLEAEGNVTINGNYIFSTSDSNEVKEAFDRGVKLRNSSSDHGAGGVIGLYKNNNLDNTLIIQNNKVQVNAANIGGYSGGVIGIIDGTDSASYVKVENFVVNSDTNNYISSGLVGYMKNKGHFLDIDGLISLSGKFNVGLVYKSDEGVIRIKGITDLGRYYSTSDASTERAQLCVERNNTLIYALGTGSSTENWAFYRAQSASRKDDLRDWGEVLRLDSTLNGLTEDMLFTVDLTHHHTVTVAAPVTSMDSLDEFVKTALNIYFNDGDHEALLFQSDTRSATLLQTDLEIKDNIDLSNTGILGLTKDYYYVIDPSKGTFKGNIPYSGKFEGNNHKITLDIGSDYGANIATYKTNNEEENRDCGAIMAHTHSGLFARINDAIIQNLNVDGNMHFVFGNNISNNLNHRYVGAIAAEATGNITLDNINISTVISIGTPETGVNSKIGGVIGTVTGSENKNATLTNLTLNATFNTKHKSGNGEELIGGCIGYFENNHYTITANNITLKSTYAPQPYSTNTNANNKKSYYAGFICSFNPVANNNNTMGSTISLKNISVFGEKITHKGNDNERGNGGLLGHLWADVDVTIGDFQQSNGITIGTTGDATNSPTIVVDGGKHLGGLVYKATGHWLVNYVKVIQFDITCNKSGNSFGFLVNNGVYTNNTPRNSALYLELKDEAYDIGNLLINTPNNFSVYDEIVAYTKKDGTNLTDNGQAIVSIRIPGGAAVSMNGTDCNTYQNRTDYGKNTVKYNSNTRYYYNLDSINDSNHTKTDAEKLLYWSLNKYAHPSLVDREFFPNQLGNTIQGNFDMSGISYYPVKVTTGNDTAVNIGNATIKFYNDEIHNSESGTGNSDSFARTNKYLSGGVRTQHHLMHQSLFLDYLGNLNINGALKFQGNVCSGIVEGNTQKSGFLICGTLGGNVIYPTRISTAANGSITFDNAKVNNANTLSPLLIYEIQSYTNTTLSNIKTENYGTVSSAAASSLIGNVGNDTAQNINIVFSHLTLDARKQAISNGTANTALTSAYGSSKSIFSQATLLNSFKYASGSMGVYNYEISEDWNGTTPLHNVTYGYEINHSIEYSNSEYKYYNSNINTDPTTNNNNDTSAYDFNVDYFLRYVYESYTNGSDFKHELMVNVANKNIIEGCGRYNDPYIIRDGIQLKTLSFVMEGSSVPTNFKICLPTDNISGEEETGVWCGGDDKHAEYTWNGTNFTATDKTPQSKDVVRQYLAGAYYIIDSSETNNIITLPSTFKGLGAESEHTANNYSSEVAFRGVIVGKAKEVNGVLTYPTIINESAVPFIISSNGSVVKNLTFKAVTSVVLEAKFTDNKASSNNAKFQYSSGCPTYGVVIGQVMGGDNIIDNVGVTFEEGFSITLQGDKSRLIPVGGYIGVVLNGGVIFRNMSSQPNKTGLTYTQCSAYFSDDSASPSDANDLYLYVNPIIGRVIAGYAFTESTSYEYEETNVTMKNGIKNFSIPNFVVPTNPSQKISVKADSNSTHEISLPNGGQSLCILSYIINSGAASALYTNDGNGEYCNDTSTPWFAYREYTCTRNGNYDYVGLSNENAQADRDIIKINDKYSGSTKNPYIVLNYTNYDNDGKFRIRSVANGNNTDNSVDTTATVSQLSFFEGGTYNLPASYRGIGSLYYTVYYNDANKRNTALKLMISVSEVNGNYATINFNTHYQEYDKKCTFVPVKLTNDTTCVDENYGSANNAGLGLFSQLNQIYNANNYIENFILSGSIFCDIRKVSNGEKVAYNWYDNTENDVSEDNVISVGGIAGCLLSNANDKGTFFNIRNIMLDGINFEGPKAVGGIIGFVHRSSKSEGKRVIENCGTNIFVKNNNNIFTLTNGAPITIKAGVQAGGLIGFILKTSLQIKGISVENVNTTIKIHEILTKNTSAAGKRDVGNNTAITKWWLGADFVYAAGGIIGVSDVYNKTKNKNDKFILSDYTIEGDNLTNVHCNHIYSNGIINQCAGGLMGVSKAVSHTITNVKVTKMNFKAVYTGGYFGRCLTDNANAVMDVENFTLDGIDTSNHFKIDGVKSAGGLFGYFEKSMAFAMNLNSINVLNYDITSDDTSSDGKSNVGGIAAIITDTKDSSGIISADICNIVIDGCNLKSNYITTDKDYDDNGTGFLIGTIYKKNDLEQYGGHNILVHSSTINHYEGGLSLKNDINTIGYLIGNNRDKSVVKLVAVTINNCNNISTRLVGKQNRKLSNNTQNGEQYGENGYVVLADYNGTSATNTLNTDNAIYANNITTDPKDIIPYPSPYVAINPITTIGSESVKLTGDGIASASNGLVINDILIDSTNRYKNVSSLISDFNSNYISKLSTYNTEQGTNLTNDFGIIVLDMYARESITSLLNTYIGIITNTNGFNYGISGGSNAGIYKVSIYKMAWNGDQFDKQSQSNLKVSGDSQFYYNPTDIDSGNDTFTLIDVCFLDPNNSKSIAYHVYVPVFIKRMLKYDFKIGTLSGTDYYNQNYDDERFGKDLMENLGTPVSLYFKYKYLYTQSEWQALIDNGLDLYNPYNKRLIVNKIGTSSVVTDIDSNTILVLVDRNNNGKAYYGRWGTVYDSTNNTLRLELFREALDNNDSQAFKPVPLSNIINVTGTENAEGKYVVDNENPTISAIINGQIMNLRYKNESDSGTFYTLTCSNGDYEESYYISIFTNPSDSNKLCHYNITGTETLHGVNGYNESPTRINNSIDLISGNGKVDLILGNIFTQNNIGLTTLPNNEEISTQHNYIDITMNTTIGIHQDIRNEISGFLSTDNYHIYQSFLVYLTKQLSASDKQKIITGSPIITGSYSITAVNSNSNISEETNSYPYWDKTTTYVEFRNGISLNEFLVNGGGANISGTFNFSYLAENSISEQFPYKSDPSLPNIGTSVSGRSSIGFVPSQVAYSKVYKEASDSAHHMYYCYESGKRAKLTYTVRNDQYGRDYGNLGINPLDSNDLTSIPVPTIGILDIMSIFDEAVDYDKVLCTIELYCRADDYANKQKIDEYWNDITITNSTNITPTDEYYTYTFRLNRSDTQDSNLDTTLEIPIDFSVITGSEFEAGGTRYYSNYKVKLIVELQKEVSQGEYQTLVVSKAEDVIVYTNARIRPDFID